MIIKFPLVPITTLLLSFALFITNPTQALSQQKADSVDSLAAAEGFAQATGFLLEGLFDQSISSFVSAGNEYSKSKNEQQIIACYLGIATCYSLKGDFKKSLEFNEKALSLHKSKIVGDPEGLDLIISNIALCKKAQNIINGNIQEN